MKQQQSRQQQQQKQQQKHSKRAASAGRSRSTPSSTRRLRPKSAYSPTRLTVRHQIQTNQGIRITGNSNNSNSNNPVPVVSVTTIRLDKKMTQSKPWNNAPRHPFIPPIQQVRSHVLHASGNQIENQLKKSNLQKYQYPALGKRQQQAKTKIPEIDDCFIKNDSGLDAGGSVDSNCIHDQSILKEYTEGHASIEINNNSTTTSTIDQQQQHHHVKRITSSFGNETFDDTVAPDCSAWNR